MKYLLSIVTIFLLMVCLYACQNSNKLNQAYKNIYLSKYAIDFPATKEKLDNCINNNITTCVELYQKAKSGKDLLLSYDADKALEYSLNVIKKDCLLNTDESYVLCKGAIISLYYFNSHKHDSYILDKFENFPSKLNSIIFGYSSYAWYSNRSDKKRWLSFIERIPDDQFIKIDKQRVIYYFMTPESQINTTGVTLL